MGKERNYDVAVIGAGSAGIAAAIAAAKNGAKTLLVESSSVIGGDLLSGLPIDGCRTTAGEWIVGGVAKELFDACDSMDGYIGSIYDRRNIWVVMVNPKIMGFAILKMLAQYGVDILPYSQVDSVVRENGHISMLTARGKTELFDIKAKQYIDCTGDGDVACMCDVPYEMGDENGELQPMTMVFQIRNVHPKEVLSFVLEHPENCGLAENPNSPKSAKELAQELYDLGFPKVFFSGKGPLLQKGIASGELHSCSMLAFNPNAKDLSVVTVNTTRLVTKDCISADVLGKTILDLTEQVENAFNFIKNNIPGCQDCVLDGVAPRLGIRESRRILGEYYLTGEEVSNGLKRADGIAKGGHEVDIHGKDEKHTRITIKNAGSYDIPLGCLIPKGMTNLMMAGRCLSADRVAHSSARVMGTCMAMGQAAGQACAIALNSGKHVCDIDTDLLRDNLRAHGAIVDY